MKPRTKTIVRAGALTLPVKLTPSLRNEAARRVAIKQLAAKDPAQAIPGANPDDPNAEAKLRAVAAALGIEPSDATSILAAVAALVSDDAAAPVQATRLGVTLTASELAECKRAGADPKVYAANAKRLSRRGGR